MFASKLIIAIGTKIFIVEYHKSHKYRSSRLDKISKKSMDPIHAFCYSVDLKVKI